MPSSTRRQRESSQIWRPRVRGCDPIPDHLDALLAQISLLKTHNYLVQIVSSPQRTPFAHMHRISPPRRPSSESLFRAPCTCTRPPTVGPRSPSRACCAPFQATRIAFALDRVRGTRPRPTQSPTPPLKRARLLPPVDVPTSSSSSSPWDASRARMTTPRARDCRHRHPRLRAPLVATLDAPSVPSRDVERRLSGAFERSTR